MSPSPAVAGPALSTLARVLCLSTAAYFSTAICFSTALAAEIGIQEPVYVGNEVRITVVVNGGANESVAGLQFDVSFDSEAYTLSRVELGDAAYDADKDAIFTDLISGRTRVLVTGMNQNVIGDGDVAMLVFEANDGNASSEIALERPIVSDPFGFRLDVPAVVSTEIRVAEIREDGSTTEDTESTEIARVEARQNSGVVASTLAGSSADSSNDGNAAVGEPTSSGTSGFGAGGFGRDDGRLSSASAGNAQRATQRGRAKPFKRETAARSPSPSIRSRASSTRMVTARDRTTPSTARRGSDAPGARSETGSTPMRVARAVVSLDAELQTGYAAPGMVEHWNAGRSGSRVGEAHEELSDNTSVASTKKQHVPGLAYGSWFLTFGVLLTARSVVMRAFGRPVAIWKERRSS